MQHPQAAEGSAAVKEAGLCIAALNEDKFLEVQNPHPSKVYDNGDSDQLHAGETCEGDERGNGEGHVTDSSILVDELLESGWS